jgi:hypothetical protein
LPVEGPFDVRVPALLPGHIPRRALSVETAHG